MRLSSTLALVSSALALAACGGGGGISGVASRSQVLSVCGIMDTSCVPTPTPSTATTDTDGDGTPDATDTNGSVGSGAGGNVTGLTTGNRTLAIRASSAEKATTADTALSSLTSALTPTRAATEAAILSTNKPTSLKFEIDSKSATNSQWAVPIEQSLFMIGTRDLTWMDFNHVNANSIVVRDRNGNILNYDPGKQNFVYSVTNTYNGQLFNFGTAVDLNDDFYWNQLKAYMGSKANGGARDGYREYRAIDRTPTVNRDEALQVWAWSDNSFSSHYGVRDGEEWSKHAWAYGGKEATTMPTTGSATYNGRFVGTAKTAGFVQPKGAEINPNAIWRVQGRSQVVATFGTNDIRGTLSTESWTSKQAAVDGYYTWFTQEAVNNDGSNISGVASVATTARPDYSTIYNAQVVLSGKIKASTTTAVATTTTPTTPATPLPPPVLNSFDGTATLSSPYISTNNPLYGGFFGAKGTEVTGIFSVAGEAVNPVGGSNGLIGNEAAFLDMNGSFNAKCTIVVATGLCAP